ncbi:MAG: ABC transporter permease subunit [Clostridia bacterium]|nr:ABC transporter permease subunit [Clostridia bacterium]
MFKVISAEFKKTLSKPGIYILSIILAIILVLGVFIYHPTVYADNRITLTAHTFVDKHNQFMGSPGADKKSEIDTQLAISINNVKNYRISSNDTINLKTHIDNLISEFESSVNDYRDCSVDGSTQDYINNIAKPKVLQSLTKLNSAITQATINASNGSYALLSTEKNYETYKDYYLDTYEHFQITKEKSQILSHCTQYENEYKSKFYKVLDHFIYPNISDALIKDYTVNEEGTKFNIINARLNSILIEIDEYKQLAISNADKNSADAYIMDELANEYINTANSYINLVKYDLLSNAFSYTSKNDELDIMYIKNYSEYNSNSLLTRYTYLFENNQVEDNYAHPLTIGVTSNHEINAYDYAYFVLRIFSFVIIIYAIMMACGSIAGEIKEGSMRYYAIRPVSRSEIFMGKLTSIIILSSILLIFSAIIAMIVGGTVYSYSSLNILTIFNGMNAITMHPIAMLSLFLISTLIELIIYTSIAMLIATIVKSDLFAVTIMLVIYLLNTLLPMFAGGANSWLAFYPFSHINLYSLFGSSVYAVSNNFFNLLFGAKVYIGTNIWLTSCTILIFIVLALILAIKSFKNKEL